MKAFKKRLKKNLKKSFQKKKRKQINFNSDTLTTKVNMTSNRTRFKNLKKNIFKIICYNCNKKRHYD